MQGIHLITNNPNTARRNCLKILKGSSAQTPSTAWTVGLPRVVGAKFRCCTVPVSWTGTGWVKPGVAHPCVSKAGDHTSNRTAARNEYSRAIHDEFVNMLGREDHPRNEEYREKIWRIQKEWKGKSDLQERNKRKGRSTQMGNLKANDIPAKESANI